MNFLAHLFLSCDNEELLIGNFIADFIKIKEVADYSPEIQKGIDLHRQIDTYTDQHPMVKQGVHRLRPHHRKYAPVVLDILYDYILVNNWSRYSGQSINGFAKDMYEILEKRMDELPAKLRKRLPGMIEANWLEAYGTKDGLIFTFQKMDERTSFPSNFVDAFDHMQADYKDFENEFNLFFPELIQYVDSNCKC